MKVRASNDVERDSRLPGATASHNTHQSTFSTTINAIISTPNSFQTTALTEFATNNSSTSNPTKSLNYDNQATMSPNVLSVRDTNVQLKPTPSPEKEKPKSLEYHRQVLQSRINDGQ